MCQRIVEESLERFLNLVSSFKYKDELLKDEKLSQIVCYNFEIKIKKKISTYTLKDKPVAIFHFEI